MIKSNLDNNTYTDYSGVDSTKKAKDDKSDKGVTDSPQNPINPSSVDSPDKDEYNGKTTLNNQPVGLDNPSTFSFPTKIALAPPKDNKTPKSETGNKEIRRVISYEIDGNVTKKLHEITKDDKTITPDEIDALEKVAKNTGIGGYTSDEKRLISDLRAQAKYNQEYNNKEEVSFVYPFPAPDLSKKGSINQPVNQSIGWLDYKLMDANELINQRKEELKQLGLLKEVPAGARQQIADQTKGMEILLDRLSKLPPNALQSEKMKVLEKYIGEQVGKTSLYDKMLVVLSKVPEHLGGSLGEQLKSMLTAENLAIAAGTMALWAASHAVGAGEAIDVALFIVGAASLGSDAIDVGKKLISAAKLTAGAKNMNDLDMAAKDISDAVVKIGIDGLLATLGAKASKSVGKMPKVESFELPKLAMAQTTLGESVLMWKPGAISFGVSTVNPRAGLVLAVANHGFNPDDNVFQMSGNPENGGGGKVTNRKTGNEINPESGRDINPKSGRDINPTSGKDINPLTDRDINPKTGRDINPKTGNDLDLASGKEIDPRTNKPTGQQVIEAVNEHGSIPDALKAVKDKIGDLGADKVPNKVKMFKNTSKDLEGLVNGYNSADGKKGWRLDYDPKKGIHFNWFDWEGGAKGNGAKWGAEIIKGSYDDYVNMLLEIEKFNP